ncbi:MAG: hypothetical protein KR126chlam6_01488 [Candidatus Anoxychlamydiales bacterium]|nr:hypothetical protein [Candidatus Anoxychlamydiales bacterium]
MKIVSKEFSAKILNLFYPNCCLHCSNELEKKYYYFCRRCLMDFSFVSPTYNSNVFAVFENSDVFTTILRDMKNQKILSFFKIAAAFIVIQHFRLKWEKPDVIISMSNGYVKNHVDQIALDVAHFFNVPFKKRVKATQIALFIDDVMVLDKFIQMKKQFIFKKAYALGLCFEIFFDDF